MALLAAQPCPGQGFLNHPYSSVCLQNGDSPAGTGLENQIPLSFLLLPSANASSLHLPGVRGHQSLQSVTDSLNLLLGTFPNACFSPPTSSPPPILPPHPPSLIAPPNLPRTPPHLPLVCRYCLVRRLQHYNHHHYHYHPCPPCIPASQHFPSNPPLPTPHPSSRLAPSTALCPCRRTHRERCLKAATSTSTRREQNTSRGIGFGRIQIMLVRGCKCI